MKAITGMLAALGLAGCATTANEPAPDQGAMPDEGAALVCNSDAAGDHVGQQATQAIGATILKDSGARTLRWGPPGGAWTMDYRQDRVNVRYDEKMIIMDITCG
jgi:hypothetical protein